MGKCLLIMLIVLSGTQSVAADYPAPVEVHMDTGDALYMYDCYPLSADSPTEWAMMVYVTYADDFLVGYGCKYGAGAWIRPFAPSGAKHVSVRSDWTTQ
jgi:hypothetical protein